MSELVIVMAKHKKPARSLDVKIFCCKKCEKEIELNTPKINCIICTSSFHLNPDCAPACLFKNRKCFLPEWMINAFICTKACSEVGVAGNPMFMAMQKEN